MKKRENPPRDPHQTSYESADAKKAMRERPIPDTATGVDAESSEERGIEIEREETEKDRSP